MCNTDTRSTSSVDDVISVQCNPSYMPLPCSLNPYLESDSDSDYVNDSDDTNQDFKKTLPSPVANDHELPTSTEKNEYQYMENEENNEYDNVFM